MTRDYTVDPQYPIVLESCKLFQVAIPYKGAFNMLGGLSLRPAWTCHWLRLRCWDCSGGKMAVPVASRMAFGSPILLELSSSWPEGFERSALSQADFRRHIFGCKTACKESQGALPETTAAIGCLQATSTSQCLP